jgi:hypothetical protein
VRGKNSSPRSAALASWQIEGIAGGTWEEIGPIVEQELADHGGRIENWRGDRRTGQTAFDVIE